MSFRTRFGILALFLAAAFAGAASVSASQDDLNNAFNEFYRRIRASTDRSAATVHKLEKEILDPAFKAAQHAKKGRSGFSESSPASSSSSATSSSDDSPIMNAKDVPAEIDFPAGKPKSAKAALHPAAGPSPHGK